MRHPRLYQVEIDDGKFLTLFGTFHASSIFELPTPLVERILDCEMFCYESDHWLSTSYVLRSDMVVKVCNEFQNPELILPSEDLEYLRANAPIYERIIRKFCKANGIEFSLDLLRTPFACVLYTIFIGQMDGQLAEAALKRGIPALPLDNRCGFIPQGVTVNEVIESLISNDSDSGSGEDPTLEDLREMFRAIPKGLELMVGYFNGDTITAASETNTTLRVDERNQAWLSLILDTFRYHNKVTAGVGAAHIPGLLEALSRAGYSVTRLQLESPLLRLSSELPVEADQAQSTSSSARTVSTPALIRKMSL